MRLPAQGVGANEFMRATGEAKTCVWRWVRRLRESGAYAALPMGGQKPFIFADERDWLLERFAAKPDLTLRGVLADRMSFQKERRMSFSGRRMRQGNSTTIAAAAGVSTVLWGEPGPIGSSWVVLRVRHLVTGVRLSP